MRSTPSDGLQMDFDRYAGGLMREKSRSSPRRRSRVNKQNDQRCVSKRPPGSRRARTGRAGASRCLVENGDRFTSRVSDRGERGAAPKYRARLSLGAEPGKIASVIADLQQ